MSRIITDVARKYWMPVGREVSGTDVASLDITDLGDYLAVRFFLSVRPATDSVNLNARFSDDNGLSWYNTSGDYRYVTRLGRNNAGTAVTGGAASNSDSIMSLCGSVGQAGANERADIVITWLNVNASDEAPIIQYRYGYKRADNNEVGGFGCAQNDVNTSGLAQPAIQFLFGSGNIDHYSYTMEAMLT